MLSKDEFIVLKEEGDKTDGDVLEEVVQAESFIWKDPLEMAHNIQSAKNKILEADPNLERSGTHQGTEKMLTLVSMEWR